MECRVEDLSFLDRAPHRFVNEGVMPVSAEQLFEVLVDAPRWSQWFVDLLEAHWTSPAPYGVGSTRKVKLKPMTVDETILAFEPGKRFAFRIDRAGLPLVRAMIEDYAIEPLSPSSCKLRSVAAYDPTLLMTVLHPITRIVFGAQFRGSIENLTKHLTPS